MFEFHQYIKACRLQKGLSVEQVAQATDISRSLLYQYEAKKTFPNGKNLIKLARFYHFSLDQMFSIVPQSEQEIPLYNPLGHQIYKKDFPHPPNCAYYQLNSKEIVLVNYTHHFQSQALILGQKQKKMDIFQVVHCQTQFFLLDKKGKLYPFNDKEVVIIGHIIQFIRLFMEE